MATLVGAHNEICFEGYLLTSYVARAMAILAAIKSKVDLVADEVQVAPKCAANEFLPDFAAALHTRPPARKNVIGLVFHQAAPLHCSSRNSREI